MQSRRWRATSASRPPATPSPPASPLAGSLPQVPLAPCDGRCNRACYFTFPLGTANCPLLLCGCRRGGARGSRPSLNSCELAGSLFEQVFSS
eukprot:scaffold2768_cov32-Tisochrysis_lutea.AAC.3